MEALIYARVSTKEQEESGYSLPAQKKILEEYCEKKELKAQKIFSVAESASGKQERLIFKEMLEHARKKKIKNLVFEKVDRAARNFKEAVALNDWLEEDSERKIHSVKDSLVLHRGSSSQEKLNWGIRIVLAKNYTDNLSEEVKKGQKEKVSQGEFPGMPPLGYRSEGPRGHRVHFPDESVAPYIKKMFKLYASGLYSTEKLAKIMEKDGLRSRYGNVIKKRLIWEMLNNPYYIGKFRWNGIYHQGNHEPLVSEELFNIVQNILHKRAVHYTSKKDFLFKGMMKCAKCGCRIGWEEHKGHVYGHCNYKYKNCDQRDWMREDRVFEEIAEELGNLVVKNPRISEWVTKSLRLSHLEDTEYKENKLMELQANYKRLEKRLDRLYEDRLDELITDESYKERFARFTREKEEIQKEIERLSEESRQQQLIGVKIFQRAEVAQEKFRQKVPSVQRKILKDMCESIKVMDGKPQIEYTIAMQMLKRAVVATNKSSEINKIAEIENNFSEPVNFSLTKAKTGSLEPACDIWRAEVRTNHHTPEQNETNETPIKDMSQRVSYDQKEVTMGLSKKLVDEYKQIVKDDYGKELTDQEAREQAQNLVNFFEIIYECEREDHARKERLKKEPNGFPLETEGYSCCLCGETIYEGITWYDKYGIKCEHCQKAIEKNQIPKKLCKDRDLTYKSWEMKSKFGLHPQTVAKMVREGKIKERVIKNKDGKGIHARLYIKTENPDLKPIEK